MALARLLGAVMRETLLRGGRACIPLFPRDGLSESLVDPAVALAAQRAAPTMLFGRRVAALRIEGDRVDRACARPTADPAGAGRRGGARGAALGRRRPVARACVAPTEFQAILNIHFRIDGRIAGQAGFIGLIGGTAEWVFVKRGHVSVTISAANRMVDQDAETIAARGLAGCAGRAGAAGRRCRRGAW